MTDVFSPKQRSYVMSRIRSKDTKIELAVAGMLCRNKIKFARRPRLFGRPDFLAADRIAVFCDGDFWHGHDYENRRPRQRYWLDKIEGNMKRDRQVTKRLRKKGCSVLRLWERDIERRPDVCKAHNAVRVIDVCRGTSRILGHAAPDERGGHGRDRRAVLWKKLKRRVRKSAPRPASPSS